MAKHYFSRRQAMAALAGLAGLRQATAQTAAAPPIRMIVPYSAGGVTDLAARLLATEMSRAGGIAVVVDNRPGAGGNIGVEAVVRAAPDGQTLLMAGWGNMVMNPHLYPDLRFSPLKDLEPVALTWTSDHLVVVNPRRVAATTLRELVELARSRPQPLTMGSAGNGSGSHIVGELFQSVAGVRFTHVPYKGTGQAINDLLGGHIDLMFDSVPSASPNVLSGGLRALAITGEKRDPKLPAVPTFAEAGFTTASATGWGGVLAPRGTPPETLARLAAALQKAATAPAVADGLQKAGGSAVFQPPQQFRGFIQAEYTRWGDTIRRAGITL